MLRTPSTIPYHILAAIGVRYNKFCCLNWETFIMERYSDSPKVVKIVKYVKWLVVDGEVPFASKRLCQISNFELVP